MYVYSLSWPVETQLKECKDCNEANQHNHLSIARRGGIIVFASQKISFCEETRLKGTQNLKYEDGRLQNCLVFKTEDLAAKP